MSSRPTRQAKANALEHMRIVVADEFEIDEPRRRSSRRSHDKVLGSDDEDEKEPLVPVQPSRSARRQRALERETMELASDDDGGGGLRRSSRRPSRHRGDIAVERDDLDEIDDDRRYPKRRRMRVFRYEEEMEMQQRDDEEEDNLEEEEEEEEEEDEEDGEPVNLRRTSRSIKPVQRFNYGVEDQGRGGRPRGYRREHRRGGGGGGGGHRREESRHDRIESWMRRFRSAESDHDLSDHGNGNLGGVGVAWRPDLPVHAAAGGVPGLPQSSNVQKKAGQEITSVQVDSSITWDVVGGLGDYIRAIKEMVFLPLVYPEVFSRFSISPPRGLLLYGPPGTGKTLLARALAASASRAGKSVTFFMRKGADVLSKWVGESERQLRALFEEAQKQQPSIIFFDEIDGLAPLRNGKQDQIHNSIVSTLLALMDGLDSRGQVIVIGATNRIDAIDSALRRPGRFDREFIVPLPTVEARESIIKIHTKAWEQKPADEMVKTLAEQCVGYSGADIKALCTEAAIRALRRVYPQIYDREERLLIDASTVRVEAEDFTSAREGITPAAHRSAVQHARPIPSRVEPCLRSTMNILKKEVVRAFPAAKVCLASETSAKEKQNLNSGGRGSVGSISVSSDLLANGESTGSVDQDLHLWAMIAEGSRAACGASRLLIAGAEGSGQVYVGPALLHELEALPCHTLALPSLLADDSSRSPEEALVRRLTEARRSAPAVLYLPHLQLWWESAPHTLRVTLWMLLEDIPPDLPLFLIGVADVPIDAIDHEALALFGDYMYELTPPSDGDRRALFDRVRSTALLSTPPRPQNPKEVPDLPVAPPMDPPPPTEAELRMVAANEEARLRTLRMFLREKVLLKLLNDRRWLPFSRPELNIPEGVHVSNPMDLSTMLWNLDEGKYPAVSLFLKDIQAITLATKQFFEHDLEAARIISRAHALEDTVSTILAGLDEKLVKDCEEITKRGGPALAKKGHGTPSKLNEVRGERVSARMRGVRMEAQVLFQDPEALIREQRKERLAAEAVEAAEAMKAAEVAPAAEAEGDADGKDAKLHGDGVETMTNGTTPPLSKEHIDKEYNHTNAENVSDKANGAAVRDSRDVTHTVMKEPLSQEIKSMFDNWLDYAVEKTAGSSLRKVERLYSLLCREVEARQLSSKKTELCDCLTRIVNDSSSMGFVRRE